MVPPDVWATVYDPLETLSFDADGAGAINHAALLHGEGMVLVESERPEDLHGSHTGQGWVYIAAGDPDAHYQRAKAAGVAVLNEPHDALNGAQRGYSACDLEATCGASGPIGHSGSDRRGDEGANSTLRLRLRPNLVLDAQG